MAFAAMEHALRLVAQDLTGPSSLPLPVIALRLIGAVALCAVIGGEREAENQSAGLRTHMMVGLGAATFAVVCVEMVAMFGHRPDTIRMDPLRLIEAATAGVAFLAAGMIVLSRGKVKNLTTGAGMWVAAAIGLAAGLGMWRVALLAGGLAFLIQLLNRITHPDR